MRDRVEFSAPDAVIAKAAVDIVIREVCEWYVAYRHQLTARLRRSVPE